MYSTLHIYSELYINSLTYSVQCTYTEHFTYIQNKLYIYSIHTVQKHICIRDVHDSVTLRKMYVFVRYVTIIRNVYMYF